MKDVTLQDEKANELITSSQASLDNPVLSYLMSYKSKNSRRSMASNLKLAISVLDGYQSSDLLSFPWQILKPAVVKLILFKLRNTHEPATIRAVRVSLLGVCKCLWYQDLLTDKEYKEIRDVRPDFAVRKPKGRMLSKEELKALFLQFADPKTLADLRDAAILSLLVECGLRREECASMLYERLDLEDRSFSIIGKRDKERICYLPDSTYLYLSDYLKERGDDLGALFYSLNKKGEFSYKGITAQGIYKIVKERAQHAGIKDFTPHDLRRTFASNLIDANFDLITVRDLMGHSSVTTTQNYDRRGEDRKRRAAMSLHLS